MGSLFSIAEKPAWPVLLEALHGKLLPVYGDREQVRDGLFIEDHCVAIAQILEADVAGETFNFGGAPSM
jgi:dTDP-glucose 4,6-dehydratase